MYVHARWRTQDFRASKRASKRARRSATAVRWLCCCDALRSVRCIASRAAPRTTLSTRTAARSRGDLAARRASSASAKTAKRAQRGQTRSKRSRASALHRCVVALQHRGEKRYVSFAPASRCFP
eukprot:6038692-Pleurochrysis_carterae.AAC.1